jgi:hypothetical protein
MKKKNQENKKVINNEEEFTPEKIDKELLRLELLKERLMKLKGKSDNTVLDKYNFDDIPHSTYSRLKDVITNDLISLRKEILESQIDNQNKKYKQCCQLLCFIPNVFFQTTLWFCKAMIILFIFIFILLLVSQIKTYFF